MDDITDLLIPKTIGVPSESEETNKKFDKLKQLSLPLFPELQNHLMNLKGKVPGSVLADLTATGKLVKNLRKVKCGNNLSYLKFLF